MFFIYGWKDQLENDNWYGQMRCPNCLSETEHMFKLHKRYPTLFFVKIPLGKVIKIYLVCTNCGANRVVKKNEYKNIRMSDSISLPKVMPAKDDSVVVDMEHINAPVIDREAPVTGAKISDSNTLSTEINESQSQKVTVAEGFKTADISKKQQIIDNKSRLMVKKKESEKATVVTDEEATACIVESETASENKTRAEEKILKVIDGKPHAVTKKARESLFKAYEQVMAEEETDEEIPKLVSLSEGRPSISKQVRKFFEIVAISAVIVLLGVIVAYFLSDKPGPDYTTDVSKTSESQATVVPFSKGYVDGNKYYNNWLNIAFELPENYTEADESFYDLLESQSTDEYGMYFVSDKSEYVAIGFADLSSDPYVTAEEFVEAAAEITKEQFSEYGNVYTDSVLDVTIAGKKFKYIDVFVGENAVLSIFAYKIDNRMCYMNVLGRSWSDNFDLVFSIGKMY